MPLASWFGLHWYGPAVAPAIVDASVTSGGGESRISIREAASAQAASLAFGGRSTRLFRVAFGVEAGAIAWGGNSKSLTRVRWEVKPGGVSQSDIESALLDVEFEPGWTLRKLSRLQLAWLAGNADVPTAGSIEFRSPVDDRVRIAGTVVAGERTVTTRDGD